LLVWGNQPSEKEEESMRALDCECGQHLEAANDEELFERAREHVDRDHPDMGLGDEQVRGIVEQGAYDK
jgi:predicted small metal-binding protein